MIICLIFILSLGLRCIAGTDSFILKLSFGLLKNIDYSEHPSPQNFCKQFGNFLVTNGNWPWSSTFSSRVFGLQMTIEKAYPSLIA